MKHQSLDLDRYDAIVTEVLTNTNTHLSAEVFYNDIDQVISWGTKTESNGS
jgi:hypothetical protein